MSDSQTDQATQSADAEPNSPADERPGDSSPPLAVYAQWAVFAVLVLVAVIATLRFYFAAASAIETFVTARYRPLFSAAFNLAVALACGLGLSVLVRRLA